MHMLKGDLQRKPVRVLVADDDAVLRSLVRANLSGRVDSVTEAEDGAKAWELLLGGSFELALIDLSMPSLDGYALIECIRNHPRTRHLPIVVITSTSDQEAVRRAFDVGATSFLTKPINWNLFGHHIEYLIRMDQGSSVERATKRRAEAVARAKDALIAALAVRMRQQSAKLIAAAESALWEGGQGTAGKLGLATTVMAEARGVDEILDDVLPFVRSMTEQIVVDDQPVSVGGLIARCVERLLPMADLAEVQVEVNPVDQCLRIRCDEAAMSRALGNIVRNAIEFTKPGTTVSIAVEVREDSTMCIAVDDEGPGVDPQIVARCLRPLDGQDAIAKTLEHAALGLPIANAIAQAHGGMIEVLSRAQGGARACLILPGEIVEAWLDDAA